MGGSSSNEMDDSVNKGKDEGGFHRDRNSIPIPAEKEYTSYS